MSTSIIIIMLSFCRRLCHCYSNYYFWGKSVIIIITIIIIVIIIIENFTF